MKVEIKTFCLFSVFSVTVFGHHVSEGISVEYRKIKNGIINSYAHKC